MVPITVMQMETSYENLQSASALNNCVYEEKNKSYYGLVRHDVLRLVPHGTKRLLDVGCGSGDTGFAAKQLLSVQEVIGIEFYEPAAEVARRKLDQVVVGDVEQIALNFPEGYFDCILCADVLEHTKNPWEVLRTLYHFLQNDGVLIASIPNIRHIVPLLKIIADRFEYEESGILDRTHLRFFTLHTIKNMFHQTGYRITQMEANRSRSWKFTLLDLFFLGILRPFSIYQYVVVAKKML
jgi:2-polyprenyl-3-methyl-5-hydroxy-6-metoxy-1,4-benzoquinol methylase